MLRHSFLLCIVVLTSRCEDSNNPQVTIFYETLCPASYRKLSEIFNIVKQLGDSILINLVPFGHANILIEGNNSLYMACQHGPDECTGNAWHACSHLYMRPKERLRYAICTMSNHREFINNLKKCASGETAKLLEECSKGPQGLTLIKRMANLTLTAGMVVDPQKTRRLTGVPTIFVDGYYLTRSDRMSYSLRELICQKARDKPRPCNRSRRVKTTSEKLTLL